MAIDTPSTMSGSMQASMEKSPDSHDVAAQENQYLTNVQMTITMFSMTTIGFLLLLDISVVTTVSYSLKFQMDLILIQWNL